MIYRVTVFVKDNHGKTRGANMGAEDRLKVVADGAASVPEASKITSLGRSFLYAMMERGELRYCKVGKRRLIPRSELQRLLADSLVAAD